MQLILKEGAFDADIRRAINANFQELAGYPSSNPINGQLYVNNAIGASTNDGLSWQSPKATINQALAVAVAGTVINVARGNYDEAVSITVSGVTLVGVGNRGQVAIAPSATNGVAITVTGARDVTLINIGGEGNGTGGGLRVSANCSRFRAYGGKYEGGAFGVNMQSTAVGASGDVRFVDCEFCWTVQAFLLTATGGGDPTTQLLILNCLFHNYTTDGIANSGVATADIWVIGNVFANQEDATEPTQYIDLVAGVTTGLVAANTFATTILAAAKMGIDAGVIWAGNQAQAEGIATGGGTAGRPD